MLHGHYAVAGVDGLARLGSDELRTLVDLHVTGHLAHRRHRTGIGRGGKHGKGDGKQPVANQGLSLVDGAVAANIGGLS